MSHIVGLFWEWVFAHRALRRVSFFVLIGLTLYFWGLEWKLLGLWVFVFGITEILEAIGRK